MITDAATSVKISAPDTTERSFDSTAREVTPIIAGSSARVVPQLDRETKVGQPILVSVDDVFRSFSFEVPVCGEFQEAEELEIRVARARSRTAAILQAWEEVKRERRAA